MSKKPTIFYCDDKEKWLNTFCDRHKDEYNIITTLTVAGFKTKLHELVEENNIPDIILIDLYHPKFADPNEQEKRNEIGQEAIDKLESTKSEVRIPIQATWSAEGFEMLRFARETLSDAHIEGTPIAIYTEQGLALATNTELETVAKLDGKWIIKGGSNSYETLRLKEFLNEGRRKRTYEKVYTRLSMFIALLFFIGAVSYSYFVDKIPDFVISVLSSAIIAIIPLIAPLIAPLFIRNPK